MLKTEGVYDEFCYSETSIASSLNHTYLSSHLGNHPVDRNASLLSAKLNATLSSLPDYTTELPRFNTTNDDDYEVNEGDELKNNGNRDAAEENSTTTDRPAADGEADGENADKEERISDNANREEDEVTTTTEENETPENAESDDPSESATNVDPTSVGSESISRIKNVPSNTTTLPTVAPVRSKRDSSRTDNNGKDSDPGKNGPTSQVTFRTHLNFK